MTDPTWVMCLARDRVMIEINRGRELARDWPVHSPHLRRVSQRIAIKLAPTGVMCLASVLSHVA
jgi:hypothetical protein